MAGLEVSQLAVKVTSDGIKQAVTDLDALTVAAGKAEGASVLVKTSTDNLSNAQKSGSSSATTYLASLQKKADLLGATNSQTAIYTATMKGLEDADVRLAGSLGAQVDSWKALGVAQKEAIAINDAMTKAAKDTTESLDQQAVRLRAVAEAGAMHQNSLRAEADAYRNNITASGAANTAKAAEQKTTEAVTKAQTAQMAGASTLAARTDALSKSQNASAGAVQKTQSEYAKLLGQIDPYIAKMGKLDDQQKSLADGFKKGAISLDDYNAAMGRISSARKDLGTQQMHDIAKGSNTASEAMQAFSIKTSAARRELTVMGREIARGDWGALARSTSIFVERSGLMQGALIALKSPITWAIAAFAAMGVSVYQASSEFSDFNKALILTGNYSALTASQFSDMSKQIGNIAGGQHSAASALTEVAMTGKFTAEQIGLVTRAAVEMNDLTGAAISETVSKFTELGKSPVEASEKLNDTYHYLTTRVRDQIKALEDQGDAQGAATLAIKEFSDASDARYQAAIDQANGIARAWRGVKEAVVGAWDAIGHSLDTSLSAQKESLQTTIDMLKAQRTERAKGGDILGGLFGDTNAANSKQIADLETQKQAVQMQIDLADAKTATAAATQKAEDAALLADKNSDKRMEAIKGENRLLKEQTQIKKDYASMYANDAFDPRLKGVNFDVNGQATGGGQFDTEMADAARRNTKKSGSGRSNEFAQQAALMAQKGLYDQSQRDLKDNLDSLKHLKDMDLLNTQQYLTKEFEANQNALQDQMDIAKKQEEIAKTKNNPTDAQKYANDIKRIQDLMNTNLKKYVDDEELLLDKDQKAVQLYQDQISAAFLTRQNAINDAVAGVGMGQQQKSEMATMLAARREFDAQMMTLDKNKQKLGPEVYDAEVKAQKAAYDARVAQETAGFAAMKAAQSDWKNGAISAFKDYQDSAANVAGQTATLFTSAFKGMEDSIVSFATTGKLNFKSFATSIISDMARMAAKAATSQILGGLLQLGLSAFGGSIGTGSVGAAGGQFGAPVAAGATPGSNFGAVGGGFSGLSGPLFADGGAFTNGVVNRATSFNMATMGESGPEGILPLSKTSDGSLGVKASGVGGGGGAPVQVNTTINIADGKSSTQTDAKTNDNNAKMFTEQLNGAIKGVLAKEMQQGGTLWKMNNKQLSN